MDAIENLEQRACEISEEDIDISVLEDVYDGMSADVSKAGNRVYDNKIGVAAFQEECKEVLKRAVNYYFFKSQRWQVGISLRAYLRQSIKLHAQVVRNRQVGMRPRTDRCCPACLTKGVTSFLEKRDGFLVCRECEKEAEEGTLTERRFRKIFAKHSIKGYSCPDCGQLIPASYVEEHGASCVYPNCSWFGDKLELVKMPHPRRRRMASNSIVYLGNDNIENPDVYFTKVHRAKNHTDLGHFSQEEYTDIKKSIKEEFDIVNQTILDLKNKEKLDSLKSYKKLFMYDAFSETLHEAPSEMIAYLAHNKSRTDRPLQSQIFQKFIRIIEDHLPLQGKEKEIYSIIDPELDLFCGISNFSAFVDDKNRIPNNTYENYIGGRKSKNFGPCFIGFLLDVTDEYEKSILNEVDYYTFNKVFMKESINPGTKVFVRHYRIPSHYEMMGMVNLQRLKKKISKLVGNRLK